MKFSKDQQLFLDTVLEGKNVFLTGKAGTGKSFVVKQAIEQLKKQGKNVVALAPTGIAAHNIGGQTIHSFFQLDPHGVLTFQACKFLKGEKRHLLSKVDTIVIDEVSMLRPDMLDGIQWTFLKNGCKKNLNSLQIIFVGDLRQLPAPINDNFKSVLLQSYDGLNFYDAKIYRKLSVTEIELEEIQRQSDPDFIMNLNIIREGGKSEYFRQFVKDTPTGIVLAPHNSTVAKYNRDGLTSVDGEEHVYTAEIDGNLKAEDFNLEAEVRVKEGCSIMYLANSKNNNLINGTLGVFRMKADSPFIDVKGVLYPIEEVEFEKREYVLNESEEKLELKRIGSIKQLPIKLAYALTIHKSQGLTFEAVTIDLTLPCFSKGQLYTAISRVKGPEGLTIITRR